MPAPDPRTRSICVWVLSCLFLCIIIAGCVYLILYIAVEPRADYAILGLALIATPWVFWFLTFLYRCCFKPVISAVGGGGILARGGGVPLATTAGASAATSRRGAVDSDSMVENSGARRVRFGDAVVVETEKSGNQQGQDNHQRTPSSSSSSSRHNDYDDISSPESGECERPLASLTPSC
ncbi:hypothetical protein AQUCO_01400297v1 [Aquilegia coerulea]|uniref:Uncharacterized protein n=1 Tax=Aquilegia coerulea TaxID=218851 RepID=A0A2G5DVJ9_AQUCA|nr:hypothetical protein AQUCO_01400297v1 [Aquilegia coerulea]